MKLLIKSSEVGLPNLIYQPVIAEGIPDYDEESEEFELYWNLQNKRCLEGYKPDGQHPKITGEYYFHLNFWTINRPRMLFDNFEYGDDIDSFPLYRDIDHEIFEWLEKLRVEGKNGIIGKRRRIGATVNFMSWIAHALMFKRSCECGVGAPSQDNLDKTMPLFYKGWFKMNSAMKQDFGVKDDANQKIVGFKYRDSSGERISGANSVFHISPFAKPGQFKGTKLERLFIDECGEFKGSKTGVGRTGLKDAYSESKECVSNGNYVTGTIVMAGTSDKVNNFSNDYEELVYDAMGHKYDLDYFFIPATKWFYPFFDVSTGISEVDRPRNKIFEQREEYMQMPDKVPLFKYMQSYPLITEDMFVVRANSSMDMYRINDRIEQIMGDPEQRDKVLIGTLTETKDGRVEFAQHPQGKFRITEFPINHIYKGADIGGVDDYMKDIAPQSDSLGAIVIYRRFINANIPCKIPVAVYHYRPMSRQDFFKDCLLLAKFYDCELAAEFNDSGLYEYFKRHNALKYLKKYPIIMGKRTTAAAAYGYSVKEQELDIIRTKLALFSESQELNNVYDVLFLRQMTEFDRKNTDILSAFGICLLYDDDITPVKVTKIQDPNAIVEPLVVMRSLTAKVTDTGMMPEIRGVPTKVSDWQQRLLNQYKGVPNTQKAPQYQGRQLDPEEMLYT